MEAEISVLQVEKRIRSRVKRQMEKTQREYYLNEQMKAIQKELGELEDGKDEASELEERIKRTKLTKEARDKARAELKKLRTMSPMSAEATVVRNYLDWLLSIPWKKRTKVSKDIKIAQTVLDADHYGLEKVKERIVEYLAVQQRVDKMKGPILCLVGPPGVGKTSLGKSLAKARGGTSSASPWAAVRDEAEIRGHRRTYIGSLPGKVIQSMKKAKSSNPLFMLDEIDKMGSDFRGDPSSALLEVLDPEQNHSFNDHYLEVDYDLSDVMFVCTANTLADALAAARPDGDHPAGRLHRGREGRDRQAPPVRQAAQGARAEGRRVGGGRRGAARPHPLLHREAGVRSLERELAGLARKAIKEIVGGETKSVRITRESLEKYAGVRKFRYGEAELEDQVGVTTGLAWTEVGGELLSIEAVVVPGKGKMMITGKLGDVMQESIQAAKSYARSRSHVLGIKPDTFEKVDIHIHVPEGATPKDGPSAGIAMATSIVSVLTKIPVAASVAMTGEVTLRGRVLPIGGLKEKLLAALRGGLKTVIIPKENEKDLARSRTT
jgi:ATP-dependent Lon protease